jgi:hypothetical protein
MTKPQTSALVDITPENTAELSAKFGTDPDYRASAGRRPSWAKIANPSARGAMCAECAQLQHETRGQFGPRMQPRTRRSFPAKVGGGPALSLCTRHAQAWRDRDAEDMA